MQPALQQFSPIDPIEQQFYQMGMMPAGQLPSIQRTLPGLPKLPTLADMAAMRMAEQQQPPQALERHGPLAHFMYGLSSPVMTTLRGLGVVDPVPQPQNWKETLASVIGGVLGWGVTVKTLGLSKLAGLGAAGIAGTMAKTAGPAQSAIKAVAHGGLMGGIFGAHSAWAEREPLGPQVLKSIAFGAAVGGAGYGIGRAAQGLRMMRPDTQQVIQDAMTSRKPILSSQDMQTMAKAGKVGKLLEDIPARRLAPAVEKIVDKARINKDPLPSFLKPTDHGARAAAQFDKMSPHEKARRVIDAFKDDPDFDTMFRPVFDLARAVKAPGSILKLGSRSGYNSKLLKSITEKAEPVRPEIPEELRQVSLTKKQSELLSKVIKGRTLGEQFQDFDNFRSLLNKANKRALKKYKVENFTDLMKVAPDKEVKAYVGRQAVVQDLTWQLGDRVDKIVHTHPSINLPSLKAVQDPHDMKAYLETIKGDIARGYDITKHHQWHPEIQKFFHKWNAKTGKSYADTTFMPRAMKQEFDALVSKIEATGDHARVIHHNLMTFPVPPKVAAKDLPAFIQKMDKLPDSTMYLPTNLHDSLTMRRELMPGLGRFLTPIRHALGEPFTNAARGRVQSVQKYIDKEAKWIEDQFKFLGVKPGKQATEVGQRLTGVLEGRVPQEMQGRFIDAGQRIAGYKSTPLGMALKRLTEITGLPRSDIKDVWKTINKIKTDPDRLAAFTRYSKATGVSMEAYTTQHLLTKKLYRAGPMTGAPAEKLAQELGLNNAKELKVAFQMRRKMDGIFRDRGLDPDMYIPGYLPRFREAYHQAPYQEIVASMKARGLPESEIKGYLWMNEMHRTAQGIGYTYEQDAFKAFGRYVSGYAKTKFYGDDFWDPWIKSFRDKGVARSRMELMKDLRHYMVGRPSEAENQMNAMINRMVDAANQTPWKKAWGPRPTAELSSLLAELQYMGGIGYNPFTALKNLTQKGLALSSITDDGNPLHGLKYLAKAKLAKRTPEGKFALSHLKVTDSRQFHEGLEAQHGAIAKTMYNLGMPDPIVKATKAFRDKAFWMFRKSDIDNLEDTFLAKFMYLTDVKKAPLADAVNLATKTTMATQFMYGFDSPMLYKSPFGRQLGIFMSWPLNWAQLLYDQGTSGDMHKALATVVAMAVGADLLTQTGMNLQSIHPVNTARGLLPIALLEGEDRWPLAMRSAAAGMDYMRALAAGDPTAVDASLDNLKRRMRPLVPAGVMGGRVIDFIDVAKHDWRKYDRRERLQYEMSPTEAFRSLIGPTAEAHQRVQEWQRVSQIESGYRRTRAMAVDAFMTADYAEFERLQEQLLINYGRWVEPKDIRYEMRLREMNARERQLIGLPQEIRDPFLQMYGYQ